LCTRTRTGLYNSCTAWTSECDIRHCRLQQHKISSEIHPDECWRSDHACICGMPEPHDGCSCQTVQGGPPLGQ
jgi:hypothetical protein